ncbi:MAG: AAA family ATPase [Synergistaceae bacterium]|nr:AAA family ATPase [Synergistaceae bacterium]
MGLDINDAVLELGPDTVGASLRAQVAKAKAPKVREAKEAAAPESIDGTAYVPPQKASALMEKNIPAIRWAIPGIIPEGLSILTGRGKLGKSWLALDICLAISTGHLVLGKIAVEKGPCLYLGLEDSERRLQDRIKQLGYGLCGLENLSYYHAGTIPRQHKGGIEWLDRWLSECPSARLVVIDILAKFRKPHTRGGDVYQEDTDTMGAIKALGDRHNTAILVITHDNKSKNNDDIIDNISGSSGIAGAADALLFLQRARLDKNNATITITGRDVDESKCALTRNSFQWHLEGDADEFNLTRERKAIFDFLKQNDVPASIDEVSMALDIKKTAAKSLLYKMSKAGSLLVESGKFSIHKQNTTPKEDDDV